MSETVSKTKGGAAASIEASEGVAKPASSARKSMTNWNVLADAGFVPVAIWCDGYRSSHPAELSCHSRVLPLSQNVIRHMAPEHGGGWFKMRLRLSDAGNRFPLWDELAEAGVELTDFYCPHCREQVSMSPRQIIKHLQPHAGANRVNLQPQTLCMSLGYQAAEPDELDELYTREF